MVKKIKFALAMKDGFTVRTMEELHDHFDLEKAMGYFFDGRLLEWLEDRYYEDAAEKIRCLDSDAAYFKQQFCQILGVKYQEQRIELDSLKRNNEKKERLRQLTDEPSIIENADKTAFSQAELEDLLKDGINPVYFLGEKFSVSMDLQKQKYIGILGRPKVSIEAQSWEEIEEKNIILKNVELEDHLLKNEETVKIEAAMPNRKEHKAYQVSAILDFKMSDKDRLAAARLFSAAQDVLGRISFDVDAGSRPLEKAAQASGIFGHFDIDAGSRVLEDAAEASNLKFAWKRYLERTV